MGFFATAAAEAIIRLSTLYYWSFVTALVADLVTLWPRPRFVLLESSLRARTYGVLGLIASATYFFRTVEEIYGHTLTYNGSIANETKFWTLPQNELVVRGAFVFFELMTDLTFVYAILFLTIFGPVLLDVYRAQLGRFSEEFLDHRLHSGDSPVRSDGEDGKLEMCDDQESRLEIFGSEFGTLERCFGNYLKVAGSYSLALLLRSTNATILNLFAVTGIANVAPITITRWLLHIGSQILPLVLILNFGTLLRDTVRGLSFKTVASTMCTTTVNRIVM